jgi:hypothetical protein
LFNYYFIIFSLMLLCSVNINKPIKYNFDFVLHEAKQRRIIASQSVGFNENTENANVL